MACDSPAVDSFMTRAASAVPGSVISILSRAATASRNSKDESVAQLMNEAPGSTASSLTMDPNLESVATRGRITPGPYPRRRLARVARYCSNFRFAVWLRSCDYSHNAAHRFLSASAVSLPLMSRFIDIQALALLGSAQIVLNSPGT
jgi:hypothetical protein